MKLNGNGTCGNTPRYQMTKEEIDRYFRVDPEKGEVYWRHLDHHRKKSGPLGCNDNGYRKIVLCRDGRKRLKLHNLIYNYVHGRIPKGYVVDHFDNDRSNCKISNLRLVTYKQNNYYNEAEWKCQC